MEDGDAMEVDRTCGTRGCPGRGRGVGRRPVIDVSRSGLAPDRIEVHVGETIRWRVEVGVRMRIEFDPIGARTR